MFQNVCTKHQIEVLLIAHHADDQVRTVACQLSLYMSLYLNIHSSVLISYIMLFIVKSKSESNHKIMVMIVLWLHLPVDSTWSSFFKL